MLIALWPHHWSRQQRSNATLVAALILMVLALAFLGQLLSFLPEPIGSNAQAFSDGARTTLWLTLVSGSVGLVLGLNVGAYNAEAVRAGLLAVPRGQTEAARALGLGRMHVFMDVVFPQAFKISLPPLVSNFVALLKDSSLAYAIGVVELTNVGNRIQSATFQPIATLSTVAVTYLLLTTLVTQISNAIEYRFDVEGRGQ